MKISRKVLETMNNGTRDERLYICQKEFLYFAVYYFPEYFTYKPAPFHFEMDQDLNDLRDGVIDKLMWVIYRESSKTTKAKLFEIYCICFKLRHYMCIDCYDKDNAEASTFDIAVALQTNHMLIKDFGQLYNETRTSDQKKMKKINSFITANDIKIEAISTQESVRGKIYKKHRPDYVRLDDFEVTKTKRSAAITLSIREHIGEFKTGLAPNAWTVYLCNLITEAGNVYEIMEEQKDNPTFRIRKVDVEMDGQITWPDKYVKTTVEAIEINKVVDKKYMKVSLEQKLKDYGEKDYNENLMNSPELSGDLEFDRDKVDELLQKCKVPKSKVSDWLFWGTYDASHRYSMGGDTAKGVGRDSNAAVLIDFTSTPCRQIASYANNKIAPHMFAYEMSNIGKKFGECLLIPEINNTGYATVTQLRSIYDTDQIWHRKHLEKVETKQSKMLGWETTGANRYELISQFKKAVLDGTLLILDKRILDEARKFSKSDVEILATSSQKTATRHFDLLIAAALAWVGRDYAEVSRKEGYEQKPYQPLSELEDAPSRFSSVQPHNVTEDYKQDDYSAPEF